SPHWTGDVTPYGGLGITSFNVNVGGGNFARTLRNVAPLIAARNIPWAILESNPSVPVSNALAIYEEEMAIIEQYRPAVVAPFGWGDPFNQFLNTGFEVALRDMISRIKDNPAPPRTFDLLPAFLPPGVDIGPRRPTSASGCGWTTSVPRRRRRTRLWRR
ncbi:MAG: hypothetical protein WD227_05940, partial [Vicinamibacterales bacterium]